jgi:hypothetical protein
MRNPGRDAGQGAKRWRYKAGSRNSQGAKILRVGVENVERGATPASSICDDVIAEQVQ